MELLLIVFGCSHHRTQSTCQALYKGNMLFFNLPKEPLEIHVSPHLKGEEATRKGQSHLKATLSPVPSATSCWFMD